MTNKEKLEAYPILSHLLRCDSALPKHIYSSFYVLALVLCEQPRNSETTVALRKLLEARDAVVRAIHAAREAKAEGAQ